MRRQLLTLEVLGERTLPNATAVTINPVLDHIVHAAPMHHHALTGKGHGSFTGSGLIVDAPPTYKLQGTADLAAFGRVSVQGWVTGVGFISNGRATGTLTFTNAKGSVTVDLLGPVQPGFSQLPHYLHYRIASGTGAYSKLSEEGTLRLDLHFDPLPMVNNHLVFPGGPFPTPRGTFDIHI
jgi:hypothetical protein